MSSRRHTHQACSRKLAATTLSPNLNYNVLFPVIEPASHKASLVRGVRQRIDEHVRATHARIAAVAWMR